MRFFWITFAIGILLHGYAQADPELGQAPANRQTMDVQASTPGTAPVHPAVELAMSFLGTPYKRGSSNPLTGFDCSGLVYYVFNQLQVQLPRRARDIFGRLEDVAREEIKPGDLLFFHTYARLSHVGVYIGEGLFVHAPRTGDRVKVEAMNSTYYRKRFAGARRVLVPKLALSPMAGLKSPSAH